MSAAGRATRERGGSGRPSARGQATVEFALLLPIVVLLALAVAQVALVAHDRVLLTHSAREGVRVAAVGGTDADVRQEIEAASRLETARLGVSISRSATIVEVTVRYRAATGLPIVGSLVHDVAMVAVARMQREYPR